MRQNLNFKWDYLSDYKKEYLTSFPNESMKVDIPHNLVDVPYNYFSEKSYQKIVTYRKVFDLEKPINDERVILHFSGFMLKAKIYLNNADLGEYVSGYVPVDIDITEHVQNKDNTLIVVLDSNEDNNIPPFGYAVDYLTFSGIYREVYLDILPRTYLRDICVKGNKDGHTKIIFSKIGKDNLDLTFEIIDHDEVKYSTKDTEFNLPGAIKWDVDSPYLYTLRVHALLDNEETIYECRYGYRDAEFKNDGFYLNGEKLKLRGLNRHQCYPYVGYAMPKRMQEDDAIRLKNLGVNVVRTSHYPQSEHFLDKCDELGILLIDEIPGWQHIGKDYIWREHYFNFVKAMVLKERKHPAIIAYGVRIDESQDDHSLYLRGNQIAHELDPYTQTIGVRNFVGSECLEDVYGYNDFSCGDLSHGLNNPRKAKAGKKPVLITEFMGHMQPVKPTSDMDRKLHVALRHARVLDDSLKYKKICGAIGWCFVDYYTHVDFGSGDHLCPHGVMDLFRNEKLTSYIYASQQDHNPVLEVLTNMRPGDFKEATFQDIYVATNADRVDLYKNDEFVASFYPDRKNFPHLKHPPVLVDDVLGASFKDERFAPKDREKMTKIFSYGGIYGYGHLPLKMKLQMVGIFLKYHLKWSDLVDIWNTHISTWGGYAKTYTFKAVKGEEVIATKRIAPSHDFRLNYEVNDTVLKNGDTYDVIDVRIKFTDLDGNLMPYKNMAFEIKTEGPIQLIGPSLQSLLGGQLTIYMRSLDQKGDAKLIIKSEIETQTIDLKVE